MRTAFILALFFFNTTTILGQLPPDFYDTTVRENFELPLGITFAEDGRGFVWEQAGIIHQMDTEGQWLSQPLIDISEEISAWNDHGLNGFCLDNDFLINGYFYLYYVVDLHHHWHYGTPQYNPDSTITNKATIARITRYQADPATNFTTTLPDSRTVLLGETLDSGVPILYPFHGAGTILQATDGTLLFSAGETTGGLQIGIGNEPDDQYVPDALAWGIIQADEDIGAYKSQYLGSLGGKVLRIDAETGDAPASNPYFQTSDPRSAQSRTWARGFRNPYRMMLLPNSGSHYPEDGQPGTLIVGDVGNSSWEEVNIVTTGGQNFGWPIMEGYAISWKYWNQDVPLNPRAPNPITNCGADYFDFREMLARPKRYGPYLPANPCDNTQLIPEELFPSYAVSPALAWSNQKWNTPARAGSLGWNDSDDPILIQLDAPNAPISGEVFDGYSSLAGFVYEGDQFPAEYQGKYFHYDFSGWIRTIELDEAFQFKSVDVFHAYAKDIIHLAQNPQDGSVYYTNLQGELHRITYGGNPAPIAVIEADQFYGPGPLTIAFSGLASRDPNGEVVEYSWDFGDGNTASGTEVVHTFQSPGTEITTYQVTLTVTDDKGATHSTSRVVSLNNTPPQVEITSFSDGDQYPLDATTLLRLIAQVTDAEHPDESLTYEWRTFLHHNDHFHPDPVIFDHDSYLLVSPLGCELEDYFYRIELTVTDPEGLSTHIMQSIFPYCDAPFVEGLALNGDYASKGIELQWNTSYEHDVTSMELQRSSDFYSFSTLANIPVQGGGDYQYLDQAPLRGSNIYRIKVRTDGGAFTFSNLFQISYPAPKAWSIYPNPVDDILTLSLESAISNRIDLELFDAHGQRLRQLSFAAEPGLPWQRDMLVNSLPNGAYSYRLIDGEQVYAGQILIQ